MNRPVYDAPFADPFALRLDGGYVAYGTVESKGELVFEALSSPDLLNWTSHGGVLQRLSPEVGDEYWAPEVAFSQGHYWMYYSVGHGIVGHHIRVARSASPYGPFVDLGVNLTPLERFAIDAHPFLDADGQWYLFFARDVIEADRPGTHLAGAQLKSMTQLADDPVAVLAPNADWQIYERQRPMYGAQFDWHTIEGPSVVYRQGRYWLTYSGGGWTGPGYAVSWAVSDTPLGPWSHAPKTTPRLLETVPGELIGPGHNSLTTDPLGRDAIVFHAWDERHSRRRMHVNHISFDPELPRVGVPIGGPPRRSLTTDAGKGSVTGSPVC